MEKNRKTSFRTQSIKRFLSPQPSNIPCKKPCKTSVKIGPKSKVRGACLVAQNDENFDEMEERKTDSNNGVAGKNEPQDSSTTCASQHKFDWNSFVRDPGELSEACYPVTLNTFKTMTYSINVAQRILEDIKNATGLDFLSDQFMVDRVLKNYYKNFYEQPQIRDIYKLETKACPVFVKKKIMQIPKLDGKGGVASTVEEAKNSDDNNKSIQVQPAEHVGQVVKPKKFELVVAQSTKTQANSLSPQSTSPFRTINRRNIIFIAKRTDLAESNLLLNHIRRHVQDVEKHQEILERIKIDVFRQTKPTQHNLSDQNAEEKMCLDESEEELSNITVSSQNTTTLNLARQRIQDAKELFFREYDKSNTLAYALRFHQGLKRRIIEVILKMTFEEFKEYTRIHNAPEIYDDDEFLGGFYDYAIKEPQIWPINLYMPLSALFEFLKLKGITLSDYSLEDVTPILLHWSELACTTNFDNVMRWDYYRCKGEHLKKNETLDGYRKLFYEKCWLHNIWVRKSPNVQIKKQAREILEKEVEREMPKEVASQVEEEACAAEVSNNDEVGEKAAVSNNDSAKVQNVLAAIETVAEGAIQLGTDNVEPPKPMNVENVGHIDEGNADTEMQDLGDKRETHQVNNDKEHQAISIEEIEVIKQERNCVVKESARTETAIAALEEETVSDQTIVMANGATTAQTCLTDAENLTLTATQGVLGQNMNSAEQARLQQAIDLYFATVENSCTLPYLLHYHSGPKRRVIASILNMSFPEFKQYTRIYEAAEIYENVELLKRCYEHTIKSPQVWPINLYMRLSDVFQYLKSKDVALPEIGLKYISPKLFHWRNLIATTNYDHIVIWDYYRSTGKKFNRSNTFLDPYRQSFYKKCWFHDKWIWYTPNILTKVMRCITNEQSTPAENNESSIFERSVGLHAVEQVQETSTPNVTTEVVSRGDEPAVASDCKMPRTVETGIQTSQRLLGEYLNFGLQATTRNEPVNFENPATTFLPCEIIKQEKLVPLNKLQFNLTEDEENYECVQAPDEIVVLDTTAASSQSQDITLQAPLSNSENLVTHDVNVLFSSGSMDISNLCNWPLAPTDSQSQNSNEFNTLQNRTEFSENINQQSEQEQQKERSLSQEHCLEEVQTQQQEQTQQKQQAHQIIQQSSQKLQTKQQADRISIQEVQILSGPQQIWKDIAKTNKQANAPIETQISRLKEDQAKVQQQADANLKRTKHQQALQEQQEPHLMRVKQENAKTTTTTSKQQKHTDAPIAVTRIIQENPQFEDVTDLQISNSQSHPSTNAQFRRTEEQKQGTKQILETPIQQQRCRDEGESYQKIQQRPQGESQIPQLDKSVERPQEQQRQVQTLAKEQLSPVHQQSSNTQPKQQLAEVCVEQPIQQLQQEQDIEAQLEALFGESTEMRPQEIQPTVTPQIKETPIKLEFQKPPTQSTHAIIEYQLAQEQALQAHVNCNDSTEAYTKVEIISQHVQSQQQQQEQQPQLAQTQLILQRTHTQVEEQLMLRPCSLPQQMAIPVQPLTKLSRQRTSTSTCTTKTKTVKTTKAAATRKAVTKQSDFVPQITHN
ncbi:uncharacterized protein LOC118740083, partial [Rhagoletis pomonella]|uniref:uncharacterized protein LOC118740083 n=1 Tax=Rhagoletis pomonella TaxID=28610 RepID=UPI00177F9279